ncbi:hypothetical protein [Nonomuraea sp. NPDC049158]|uniref:hypothetical protein n=1 Tax=Nonomuraea sp. NPDC049158 TaxID=3155649 RepID=UPI0033D516D4
MGKKEVLSGSAALFPVLSVAERVPRLFVDFDDGRAARVYGTAVRVANLADMIASVAADRGVAVLRPSSTAWAEDH